MKTRTSLGANGKISRRKKSLRRHTLGPGQVYSTEQQKENIEPGTFASDSDDKTTRKKRKYKTKKQDFPSEWELSLQANNRELATALEEARMQINVTNVENIRLKKQLQAERQRHIETIIKEVDNRVQGKFKVIDRYLQQTVAKLLDCTKLITSASEIICFVKPIETSTVFTPVSSNTPYCPLDTTPPPEESDKMEVTTAEVVPMETTCVELGFIDAITELHQLTQRVNSKQNGIVIANKPEALNQDCSVSTSSCVNVGMDVGMESCHQVSIDGRPMRTRRSSSVNVSYAMPSLRSKLRRGDPFTDTTFQEDFQKKDPSKKRRGRMSTGCIQKKSRYALSNLTNTITEVQEM